MDYDLPSTQIIAAENPELTEIRNFSGSYPKQLWALFFSEMWERFCFYGMRGMLMVFMTTKIIGLGMDDKVANLQYGATQSFVYAFTFIGGLFADKILGFRKSLLWGGLLMIVGSIILAYNPKDLFFIGIAFTIVGTGFFKPNISTMVGELYHGNDSRRDAGFSLFYAGINVGALLGGYFCITIAQNYSWNLAFGLAAIVMTISLITFLITKKNLGPIGFSPLKDSSKRKTLEIATCIGSLIVIPAIVSMVSTPKYTDIFMMLIGPGALIYLAYEMRTCTKAEVSKLVAALIFILFSILFWAIFEQGGGSLSLLADRHLSKELLGISMNPVGVNNSSNAFFVILFAAVMGGIWIWLSKRNKEPNTVVKFGIGFLFLGVSFYMFYMLKGMANAEGISSLNFFTLAYLVISLGELSISPIGLSIMTKLAPKRLAGMMMGMWFLASAYGQYVAGLFGAGIANSNENATALEKLGSYTDGYKSFAIYAFIAGIALIVIAPLIRKLMLDVK
jgi:proton-dependent oligopeptide transporter, POT family